MNYSAVKLHSVNNIETFYNEYETLLKISIIKSLKSFFPISISTKNNVLIFKFLPELLKFKVNKLSSSNINAVEEKTPKYKL